MFISAISTSNLNHSNYYLTNGNTLKKQNASKNNNLHLLPLKSANVIPFYCHNIAFGRSLNTDFSQSGRGYVDFLKSTNAKPEDVKDFLISTLKNERTRDKFITELTKNPEQSKNIVSLLTQKLGGKSNFLKWYFAADGYAHNYEHFLKNKYREAKSIDELLKFQPNWGYWALERKQCQLDGNSYREDELMRDQLINFNFGKLPQQIKNKYSFNKIISTLKKSDFGARNLYISTTSGGFYATQLDGGDKSAKNIYKLQHGATGKTFIIKTDRFYPEDILAEQDNPYYSRITKEAKLIRGDAVYLDACLDYYLQLNGCNDNAKLLYYDFKNNAAIYEYIDGVELNKKEKYGLAGQIEANTFFPKITNLGIYLNDIGTTFNCYKDKQGNYKIIDIGHAEYLDILKPGAQLLTFETSNLCGFSMKNALAGLNMDLLGELTDKSNATISTSNYNSGSAKSSIYRYNDSKFINIDFRSFMAHKDSKKREIKSNILTAELAFGEYSREVIRARQALVDFYKTSVNARIAGYGKCDEKTIKDITRAIHREEKLISKIEKYLA